VRQGRFRGFGHVERKDANDWLSACRKKEKKVEVETEKLGKSVFQMI
jgi:hypothetical protein